MALELEAVWSGPEPQPFAGSQWTKKVTYTRTKYTLWIPLHLLLQFINTQCQLGCCAFVRYRTKWAKGDDHWVWDFCCQYCTSRQPQLGEGAADGTLHTCVGSKPPSSVGCWLEAQLPQTQSTKICCQHNAARLMACVCDAGGAQAASSAVLKVGCECRFSVTHPAGAGDVLLTYFEAGHVDKEGRVCHGPAAECATHHLGRLSDEFRAFARAVAMRGVPFAKILDGEYCWFRARWPHHLPCVAHRAI
jgi:hypothetical protein